MFGWHRGCGGAGTRRAAVRGGRVGAGRTRPGGGGGRRIPGAGGRGVGRLRGRSRRPRAAIITEPPFSGWLCLEEPRAVGAHPELAAARPPAGFVSAPVDRTRGECFCYPAAGFPGGHF